METARLGTLLLTAVTAIAVTACNPAYLTQATKGQFNILRARQPIAGVLRDPATPPELRHKLEVAEEAVRFAHASLSLPDNGSYSEYADIKRPYAVWNVFAAPAFSLALRTWCFPVTGCVAYRGYFSEDQAREFSARLERRGDDVYMGGVASYSTLGYFRDPLLSTATGLQDASLAGLIFHELAHQRLFVPGDTVFSESFAVLVEQEGLVRWFTARGERAQLCGYLEGLAREREVRSLLDETRTRLAAIYADNDRDDARRAAAKTSELEELRVRYRALRAGWPGPPYFDAWFDGPINNASLGALEAYDQHVGTLRVILDSEGGDLDAFYERARRLARLDAPARAAVLSEIRTPANVPAAAGPGCPGAPTGSADSAAWQSPEIPVPSARARG